MPDTGARPGTEAAAGTAASGRWLVMVERAYRGSVERQYADVLALVPQLHRQSGGGVDLALRGLAASYALQPAGDEPPVRLGGRDLDTRTDPRALVRTALAAGVAVLVEEPCLAALGRSAAGRLLPGVRVLPGGALASSWPRYEEVWFW
ncbi:hypothetical protein RKE29_21315 [Streptomyces sp. B1866]|uniref:hypothetical protein n=1 Tax=Streptomyces sp. B1866 TaxID=3075431 RepID=UPI00288FF77E|nr:hypothetical protein [Streptomyces sp. B1866]MDT3399154.1 hypothetical protein [Streptomyces sp. B1866]